MALSADSTIGELLEDPRVVEYFEKNFPETMANRSRLAMFKDVPFGAAAAMSQGRITDDDCDRLDEFLETL